MIDVKRVIDTLDWLVPETRHRFDDSKNNLEEGSQGDYSPKLTKAINLLRELKNGVPIIDLGNAEGVVHRRGCLLNCRQFLCKHNRSGKCDLPKITLHAVGGVPIVSHLICTQAKEKSEKEG